MTPAAADSRANAFDLLRLFGALLVIVEHSWVLTGHGSAFADASGTHPGMVGVGIFFLTSGYLIAASWLADPSVRRFAAKRALRIYPAYAVVILLAVFVLGPLLTTLSTGAYFGDRQTWVHLLSNLGILTPSYDLPGVFTTLPHPNAVNGSLWTIRIEVLCYVAVAVLGLIGLLRNRVALTVITVAALALVGAVRLDAPLPALLTSGPAEPLAFFALGMLARALGRAAVPPWWAAGLSVLVWLVCWSTPLAGFAAIAAITLVTLAVAFRSPPALHRPTRGHDVSYGVYLLAFPIQQTLVEFGLRAPFQVLLASVAITVPLALASWHLVERPALRLKPRKSRTPAGRDDGTDGDPTGQVLRMKFPA